MEIFCLITEIFFLALIYLKNYSEFSLTMTTLYLSSIFNIIIIIALLLITKKKSSFIIEFF